MRASFIDVAGVRIPALFHHGGGDYGVLLLHGVGVGADPGFWNVKSLGQGRMAVAPDMLGYGLTGEGTYRQGPPHRVKSWTTSWRYPTSLASDAFAS